MRLSDPEKLLLRMALRNQKDRAPKLGDMIDRMVCKVDGCGSDKRALVSEEFYDKSDTGEFVDANKNVREFVATLDPDDVVSVSTRDDIGYGCRVTEVWYWTDAE